MSRLQTALKSIEETKRVSQLYETLADARQQAGLLSRAGKRGPAVGPVQLLLLAVAFGAMFRINFLRLWQWTNPMSGDPNWGHSIFIPLVSLAYLYIHFDRVKQTPARPAKMGLLVLFAGLAMFTYGLGMSSGFAQFSAYVQDLGMLTTLFGCVLAVFGWEMLGVTLFPLAYLICALPWPPYVHDLLTIPLQKIAATASVAILQTTGLNVEQAGNTIHILSAHGGERVLNVAEACSGMRSLITFIAVGLAVAFLSARPMWQKIVVSISAVPIAVACNISRIAGQGLLDSYVSRSLSEGFAHQMVGIALLVPGFLLFLLVGWVLDRVFIGSGAEKEEEKTGQASNRAEASTTSCETPLHPSPVPEGEGVRQGEVARRPVSGMYVAVLAILTVSAIVFAVVSQMLQLHFQKIPVALRQPLACIATELGPWRQVEGDRPVSDEIAPVLGTSQYLFRDYLDRRLTGDDVIDASHGPDISKRQSWVGMVKKRPGSLVRLAVTYYTGRVDAVIHLPERCNVAQGNASAVVSQGATLDVGGTPLEVRLLRLDPEVTDGQPSRYVAYCYQVNGKRESQAWRVRGSLIDVFERYAWYSKIEVMTIASDQAEARRVLADFLSHALPEIEKCLPGQSTMVQGTLAAQAAASSPPVK
jgi:exosortase